MARIANHTTSADTTAATESQLDAPAFARPQSATLVERTFPFLAIPSLIAFFCFMSILPMTWQQQAGFGVMTIAAAWLMHRLHRGKPVTLTIATLSLCATMRYACWRGTTLYSALFSPWQKLSFISALLMVLLFLAELYSFTILLLGFLQTLAPLQRPVKPMPEDKTLWPTVDILIPTYNEPLEIVRYTALAAQALDWPRDRLTLTILDDGERDEFRQFAAHAGIGYIARTEHSGAKAGNLNNAIEQTLGEYVAIFDCDHVPTRSFLQLTMGWFLADHDLALMQTPHHFYSADPFERNLKQFRTTPNEGSLFYGIVQDTNDLWNATFFCGSCAVLRRSALEEVGGIAQETVTEDAHTSLRLQRKGWNTAYINIPQAAGLATETLSGHVRQRIRWARGMAQILRTDNPLFGRGLRLPQRLCYLNATMHYLYGIPRMLFLTAPLMYLFFGLSNVPGYWAAILAFALPHLLLSNIANSRVQGGHRHSFWNEVYETVLAPYILLPTTVALLAPRHGAFNVTAKGGLQEGNYFDRRIARPFIALAALNFAGLCLAIPRYLYWDHDHAATIAINVFWTLFNLVMLGTALAVCYEQKQRREAHRVDCSIPVTLHTASSLHAATAINMANGGMAVRSAGSWKPGMQARAEFPGVAPGATLAVEVVGHKGKQVRFRFTEDSLDQQRLLTEVLYSAPDRWSSWYGHNEADRPLQSLCRILSLSFVGFWRVATAPGSVPQPRQEDELLAAPSKGAIAAMLLLALALSAPRAFGAALPKQAAKPLANTPSQPFVTQGFHLDMIKSDGILLEKPGDSVTVQFVMPDTQLVRAGELKLRYLLPESEAKGDAPIAEVRLNDVLLGSITPTASEYAAGSGETAFPVPGEVLVRKNLLTVQLPGNGTPGCTRNAQAVVPFRLAPSSQMTYEAQPLHLASDLRALPHPFLEHIALAPSVIPFVFAKQPSSATLQAAGVVASWFGMQESDTPKHFPISYGAIPRGDVVILLSGSETLPGLPAGESKRTVTLVDNPGDPYGKLLVLRAENEDMLLAAVQEFSLNQKQLTGETATLPDAALPAVRAINDAPRWVHNDRTPLSQLMTETERHTTDANPFNLYMHLSPDYNFGAQQRMVVHLNYNTDAHLLAPSSNITARFNGQTVDSYPLAGGRSARIIDVPIVEIPAAIYANTLQLQFFFNNPGSPCAPRRTSNNARLLGSSYIDLGGAVHQASMPNLKLFAKAGFPFTRRADLSDTVVLLPEAPSPELITLYLDLLAYFGEQTGYPAFRIEVSTLAEADQYAAKDQLVLGTFDDLSAAPKLTAGLPLTFGEGGLHFSLLGRFGFLRKALGSFQWSLLQASEDNTPHAADGLVAGFQSPYASGHSTVFVTAARNEDLPGLTSAMIQAMPGDAIDTSVTLWEDGTFRTYPLFTPTYYVGTLPWHSAVRYRLAENPALLLVAVLALCFFFSVWIHRWLQSKIRQRLRLLGEPLSLVHTADPLRP